MPKPKRAIALILSLFVLIVLGGFVSLAAYQYVSDRIIHQHYENSIRGLYAIEAARNILNWEESQATPPNTWTTLTGVSGTAPTSGTAAFSEATITDGFYKLTGYNGYNIKAKVLITSGNVCMYIQAYKGEEANPQDAQYLEYIHSPSPMYKYAMFSNGNLVFSGNTLYDLNGGSIHANADIIFGPSGTGLRFKNVASITAAGAIKYGKRYAGYPDPRVVDMMDSRYGSDHNYIDGMAQAPNLSTYYYTTTGDNVVPGPLQQWYVYSVPYLSTKQQGWAVRSSASSYALDEWGARIYVSGPGSLSNVSSVPLLFRGEETYFYGKQTSPSSTYATNDQGVYYLAKNDNVSSSPYSTGNAAATYNWANNTFTSSSDGRYSTADVIFMPATNAAGNENDKWFEIPGSLPQSYSWEDKYISDYGLTGAPAAKAVSFYVTESCTSGSAWCQLDPNQTGTTGWRYLKQDKNGNTCTTTTDDCYNNTGGTYGSDYVNAKDYVVSTSPDTASYNQCVSQRTANCAIEKSTCVSNCIINMTYQKCGYYNGSCGYYCQSGYGTYGYDDAGSCISGCYSCVETWSNYCQNTACQTCNIAQCSQGNYTFKTYYYDKMFQGASSDVNTDFLKNYTYGNDTSSTAITAFNSAKQSSAFSAYCNALSQSGIEDVLSITEPIEPYLGSLFDTTSGNTTTNSPYKTKAQASGIYLSSDSSALSSTLSALNTDSQGNTLTGADRVATIEYFYNWKTSALISVIKINVANMKAAGKSPSNDVIYSEVPIMLSDAENLPGTNSNDKTAVFTLVSEESVYLKGDYNTGGGNKDNWKISNIATEKRVYTLSDNFETYSSSGEALDNLADIYYYPNYPYVKVDVTKDSNGKIVSYTGVSSDQTSTIPNNAIQAWVDFPGVSNTNYFPGMTTDVRNAVAAKGAELQANYQSEHYDYVNAVDGSHEYNSLFVTPYEFEVLEDWNSSKVDVNGAFLNFSTCATYDPFCSDDYKTPLDNSEYYNDLYRCGGGTNNIGCSDGYNATARGSTAPISGSLYQIRNTYNANVQSPVITKVYDKRFPKANPAASEGVLGFTGQDSWRFISKDYFDEKTG